MAELFSSINSNRHRLTQKQKNADDFAWYREQADLIDNHSFSDTKFRDFGEAPVTEFKRKQVNYDLFNNIIDTKEFEYVCQPYGAEAGELPARFANRDIVSGKIKVLLGMEMEMPFDWTVIATNREATTRKEQTEFSKIKDFVVSEVMRPIKLHIQQQELEKAKGQKLTPEEQQNLQAQIEQETQAQTPDEVRKYMAREHQDPVEIMMEQLLEYLLQECRVEDKFNKGWKHMMLSAGQYYHVGIFNGEPNIKVVNPLYFDYDRSEEVEGPEEGEWAVAEYRMSPSSVVTLGGSELTEEQIDRIYSFNQNPANVHATDFTFQPGRVNEQYTVSVKHITFKALMKIGFLSYYDKGGKVQMEIVDENYKINREQGDIKIEWEWIPQAHEVYKILNDIYIYARPIPGQDKDIDNLYECYLPYFGGECDNLNSAPTSPMDRMKAYQYFYDVLIYRIELLVASDKGKLLAMNINAIPKSAGIDIKKVQYFMEANKIIWLNPAEEGNRGNVAGDVTNLVKEIDMSLLSQLDRYIQLAEYIERKCGSSIGVTPQMEAQIGPNDAVSNTRQNLVQSSHIIRPYFQIHNTIKTKVLKALMNAARVAYASEDKAKTLSYVLDDMSIRMLTIDPKMLNSSKFGLFIANSLKADQARQVVVQLSQAAMQNQQAELTDIIKVIRSNSITEAEELLEVSQQKRNEQLQSQEQAKLKQQQDIINREDTLKRDEWEHEEKIVVLKEEERRKTVIQQQTILSMGFDTNKDEDDDGVPDILEVAKFGVDADIKRKKLELDSRALDHQITNDDTKNKLAKQKLIQDKNKPKSK